MPPLPTLPKPRRLHPLLVLALGLPAVAAAEEPGEPLPPPLVAEEPGSLPPPPAVAPLPPPPPDLRQPRPGAVPVELEAEGPPLQLRGPGGEGYLCTTPCTLHLVPGGFTLQADAPGRMMTRVELAVRPPGQRVVLVSSSVGRLLGGAALIGLGATLSLGGLLLSGMYANGLASDEEPDTKRSGLVFGATITTVGFALLIGGGLLLRRIGWGVKQVTMLPAATAAGPAS